MTTRLDITRAQLKALAAAARESDCIVEVEVNGTIYRVIPDKTGWQVNGRYIRFVPQPIDTPGAIDL